MNHRTHLHNSYNDATNKQNITHIVTCYELIYMYMYMYMRTRLRLYTIYIHVHIHVCDYICTCTYIYLNLLYTVSVFFTFRFATEKLDLHIWHPSTSFSSCHLLSVMTWLTTFISAIFCWDLQAIVSYHTLCVYCNESFILLTCWAVCPSQQVQFLALKLFPEDKYTFLVVLHDPTYNTQCTCLSRLWKSNFIKPLSVFSIF